MRKAITVAVLVLAASQARSKEPGPVIKALPVCYAEVLKDDSDYATVRDRVFPDCMSRHGFQFKLSDNACVAASDGLYRPTCWERKQR